MKDFIQYIFGEVKDKRISKKDAMELIQQYKSGGSALKPGVIHPLLHQNTSSLSEQRFSSVFNGQEFFLRDHIIKGRKVLPGVAYLEMAHEAAKHAAEAYPETGLRIRLKNIVWALPIVVENQPFESHIGIIPRHDGELGFEIYSRGQENNGASVVHSSGGIVIEQAGEVSSLDIQSIKARCSLGVLNTQQCYELFSALRQDYGPAFRGIEQIFAGHDEVLSKLSLNYSEQDSLDRFVMHPGIMDSALQASIGLALSQSEAKLQKGGRKPYIPFALEELGVMGSCTSQMWAYIRYSKGSKAGDSVQKLDVDLCDKDGKIVIQLRGYSARAIEGEMSVTGIAGVTPTEEIAAYSEEAVTSASNEHEDMKEKVRAQVIQIMSELLTVKEVDIDPEAGWEDYGLEHVGFTWLADRVNEKYKTSVTVSELSSCPNPESFVEYVISNYSEVFEKLYGAVEAREETEAVKAEQVITVSEDILLEKAQNFFKNQVSKVIKLPPDKIEVDAPMEKYGIDSMMSMQLITQLEKTFGSLSKTLFFEYQNIRELTGYFVDSYRDKLEQLLELRKKKEAAPARVKERTAEAGPAKLPQTSTRRPRFVPNLKENREDKTQGALDIAIIGLSGRYPNAGNIEEYWENLRNGVDCITEIPKDRWDHSLYFDEDKNKPGKTYTKWGGFIDGVDRFDPLFFNISPRDAEGMDPQERLFLQCVYSAMEDAGYTREAFGAYQGFGLGGSIGVFVGVMYEEYQLYGAQGTTMGKPFALPGNPASIANRVSYFCNFHGPSMAVDTMCSSSLTAIHLACQSIINGGCKLAVAGGVNVSIHPNKYLILAQGRFASSKGRCESFGIGGDGYVPGEGVGAVILKPLNKAIEDKDHIYGVIKASALNHGGKTNGYTVPNPNAQTEVIGRAFKEAGINPRTISYIEAHGTGTSLGDPIEIAGLNKVFREYTDEKQFCAIGSAKSNIGHLESAAGIAGITKVLLQLKHRQVAPSLHSATLNPYIDFSDSPFVVQQELCEWKRPMVEIDGVTREYPRIAGISSFGAGGSNAHIVIEEYIPPEKESGISDLENKGPAVVILSAKDEDRLKVRASQILAAITENKITDENLYQAAYTLQVGREAMEDRLGIIAENCGKLLEKLEGFLEGKKDIEGVFQGKTGHGKDAVTVLSGDDDLSNIVETWIQKGKYSKILELWVKGLNFDWNRLYSGHKPCRMSLPTYPFKSERYWIPEELLKPSMAGVGAIGISACIHPLLHRNTSDIIEQRFSSTFTGEEFFLADHVINGNRILPGAACLEMARAAVEQSAGVLMEAGTGLMLKNVVWVRPIVYGDSPLTVHIAIIPGDGEEIGFEIYTEPSNGEGEYTVHCQGSAVPFNPREAAELDIEALIGKCHKELTSEQCYKLLSEIGLQYGNAHQGIVRLFMGQDIAVSKLRLPEKVSATSEGFILHPSILDSALQSSIGIVSGNEEGKTALPFALQSLEIIDSLTVEMWAYVRRGEGSKAGDAVQKLDIDLCDSKGRACARIKGYSSRIMEESDRRDITKSAFGTLLLEPYWKESPVLDGAGEQEYSEHVVFMCGGADSWGRTVETNIKGARVVCPEPEGGSIEKNFVNCALYIFKEIKTIIKKKQKGKVLIQAIILIKGEQQLFAGLSGLLRTAALENPRLVCQLIQVQPEARDQELVEILMQNARCPHDVHIRYEGGKRYIANWCEQDVKNGNREIPWKDNGVYLITGGAGGLGLIFAEEITRRVKGVTLVLTGRSSIDSEKEARLKELEALGAGIIYKQADITDGQAVNALIDDIARDFGDLNGIIHSAGVIRDNFIIKKSEEEFVSVLAPKVMGLLNLDRAVVNMELDFFILFSSISGSFGNMGQADYSTANAFMDAFSAYSRGLEASKNHLGRTLSINWPLWKDGGMHVDTGTEKAMESSGIKALETSRGIEALYDAFTIDRSIVTVLEGNLGEIRKIIWPEAPNSEQQQEYKPLAKGDHADAETGKSAIEESKELLREKTAEYLKKQVSAVIKLPADRIETDAPMERYGIDSVMSMELVNQLEKVFGSLSKTLFFEYQNIRDLTGYFVEAHRHKLEQLLGLRKKKEVHAEEIKASTVQAEPVKLLEISKRRSRFVLNSINVKEEDSQGALNIAIIGLAGRYPGAQDVEKYWENLSRGVDCITEIPQERWDYKLYFDEERNKVGKTYSKWGGFIDGVDRFDPLFFNISPREAEGMDPQERLFLQCVYSAMEDAGYTRESLNTCQGFELGGNVGVFVGVMYQEYQLYGAQSTMLGKPFALPGNPSSIANRISYFCNFHGPSMAVDTMCSSSLTSIHLACKSIINGECKLAVAGGVNVSIHPNKYLLLAQGRFASSKGRCESFGMGGDGYVPGEGVGAIILKPLSKAVKDKDHIYGVIKASALNHGGKTNGYTVPNPNAQAEVIGRAFKKAGINPRTVSYIEAHGTGTSLGDPIEITGLGKVFREYTDEKQFCAIGSAKSNIGHCESAAGIAGVTKVLLQMKYGKIAPSLHSKTLNPYIDFENSPFIVPQELSEWKRPLLDMEGIQKEYPRIAGISSFGAGGANAHVVIEEYITDIEGTGNIDSPVKDGVIIVLSAKDEDRLSERVRQLAASISGRGFEDKDLPDIAYTLQVGREPMEERLAVFAGSIDELLEKLKSYMEGKSDIQGLYRGQNRRNKEFLSVWTEDEDLQNTISVWLEKGKHAKLLDLWVKGVDIDWSRLYPEGKPRRISLPTYPFAGGRYWIPVPEDELAGRTAISAIQAGGGVEIHPLLHRNTSDFSEQRFTSTFTGREYFMKDYRVDGVRFLSAAACIEMIRAAVSKSVQFIEEGTGSICLKKVVWTQLPTVGQHPIQLHIGLSRSDSGEIGYEIYGDADAETGEAIVYCSGSALLEDMTEVRKVNIKEIQGKCSKKVLSPDRCCEIFGSLGDSSYSAVQMLNIGEGQVLVKLALPENYPVSPEQFVLEPLTIDSAINASIGFYIDSGEFKPAIPLGIDSVKITAKCSPSMWAVISSPDGNKHTDGHIFDICLCDDGGKVCLEMKGIALREDAGYIALPKEANITLVKEDYKLMTFEEEWREQELTGGSETSIKNLVCFVSDRAYEKALTDGLDAITHQFRLAVISQGEAYEEQPGQRYIIPAGDFGAYRKALSSIGRAFGEVDAVLYMWPLEDREFVYSFSSVLGILQAVALEKLKPKRIILAGEHENGLERCYLESWLGFERSIGLVMPDTKVTGVFMESPVKNKNYLKDRINILCNELKSAKAQSALYRDGKRFVTEIRPTSLVPGTSLLRTGGTYLITGGCGGLGLIFAEHLVKTRSVNLIITGRSPLDAEKRGKINKLEDMGGRVLYIQADVCDLKLMEEGLKRAVEQLGDIHGVIHAAGVSGSKSIIENDMEGFEKVLESKIKGTLALDRLLSDQPLDFVCYFSSSSAVLGDFGSCDYSIGNRFQNAYAAWRNNSKSGRKLKGKAFAINWPLWKDGGMGFEDYENVKMYLKSSGQDFLKVEEGIAVFEKIMSQDDTHHLILVGQPGRVERFLGLAGERVVEEAPKTVSSSGKGRRTEMKGMNIEQCVDWDLKDIVSGILKISRDKLDRNENLADFGFDSIGLAEFAAALTGHYGKEITPALFFGYSTIEKLTGYFMSEHKETMQKFYADEEKPSSVFVSAKTEDYAKPVKTVRTGRESGMVMKSRTDRFASLQSSLCNGNTHEPIAIIGMSGRFPGARNIDEMWDILKNGRDCIGKFPGDRFQGELYNGGIDSSIQWHCGLIPGVSEFDPLFFEISPVEAETMDPRQRLLLQESWNALEDAGYGKENIEKSKIGMFVGVEEGDYSILTGGKGGITSNHNAILAARLSYILNLSGPNMSVNTACSSGLVAAHLACQSLRNNECDTAIAAGVNIMLTPGSFMGMSQAGMLSKDGKCHTFDKRANGMVPGEAVTAVVLKPLSKAEADGDPIYAVIRGDGLNYDGKTNGITAPSGVSQANLLKWVYEQYKLNPEDIEYIVTHGTGTKLGDPIEVNALYDAFRDYTRKQNYCALTSTKTNFGHTLAASGLVSLISLVKALKEETIPASLNCEQENDFINWKESPFYVNKAAKRWTGKDGKERMGAVSAFGMSGTNAHMVLQSYTPKVVKKVENTPCYLLVLSAKTQEALWEKIDKLSATLESGESSVQDLNRLSYTLSRGRQHFDFRFAAVIQDRDDALYALKKAKSSEKLPNLFHGRVPRDFTGQEAIRQYIEELLGQGASLKNNKERYREMLCALADLYCQGYKILWDGLFEGSKPQRIHLPGYPFAREQYWISGGGIQQPENSAKMADNMGSFDQAFYEELFDKVIEDKITIDSAVRDVKNPGLNKMGVPSTRRREL